MKDKNRTYFMGFNFYSGEIKKKRKESDGLFRFNLFTD
jgi:hypothetical protein